MDYALINKRFELLAEETHQEILETLGFRYTESNGYFNLHIYNVHSNYTFVQFPI
jgi:hypothetical protein